MLWLRQVGLAFGSLVAAGLVMGLVGFALTSLLTFIPPLTPIAAAIGTPSQPGLLAGILTFVLGWLIYRDIARRDPRRFGPPGT